MVNDQSHWSLLEKQGALFFHLLPTQGTPRQGRWGPLFLGALHTSLILQRSSEAGPEIPSSQPERLELREGAQPRSQDQPPNSAPADSGSTRWGGQFKDGGQERGCHTDSGRGGSGAVAELPGHAEANSLRGSCPVARALSYSITG